MTGIDRWSTTNNGMGSVENVSNAAFPMYGMYMSANICVVHADCSALRACVHASTASVCWSKPISSNSFTEGGNREAEGNNVACISYKTRVLQCISPHQTKVNQTKHPARKTASMKMHSAEGAQKSYCSEKREEKEKREGKERNKEGRGIPSLALHHRRSACLFFFFTRRLCEFEITWVTVHIILSIVLFLLCLVVLTLPVLAMLLCSCSPCVTATPPPSLDSIMDMLTVSC